MAFIHLAINSHGCAFELLLIPAPHHLIYAVIQRHCKFKSELPFCNYHCWPGLILELFLVALDSSIVLFINFHSLILFHICADLQTKTKLSGIRQLTAFSQSAKRWLLPIKYVLDLKFAT